MAASKDRSIVIFRDHRHNPKNVTAATPNLDSKRMGRTKKWERFGRDVLKRVLEGEEGVEEAERTIYMEDPTSSRHTP